jgi:hypothetical protein
MPGGEGGGALDLNNNVTGGNDRSAVDDSPTTTPGLLRSFPMGPESINPQLELPCTICHTT